MKKFRYLPADQSIAIFSNAVVMYFPDSFPKFEFSYIEG